jgi:hypothetical protein
MKYPKLREIPTTRERVDVFRGYNHNLRIAEGEFYDMTNMSSDDYPVLSPRRQRGVYATPGMPQGMISKKDLWYVDGGNLIVIEDGNKTTIDMGLTVDATPKVLISMGAYIIIMPDKKYINTSNYEDKGMIEASVTTSAATTIQISKLDGAAYDNVLVQSDEPTSAENGDMWIDTSSVPHTLKQYSAAADEWSAVATSYVKISSLGIGNLFAEGDGVKISGITTATDLNTNTIIHSRGANYIVVTGIIDEVTSQETPITVERKMPDMDFVIESGNRLWGCRYGESNGAMVNEIYSSKLGDFKNWECYAGISSDSWRATVGSDGAFTGAVSFLGSPIFFKENCMHKVYGDFPSTFRIQSTTCRGVQKGCERSIATVNETLFYKSRGAVCGYDGSLPQEISADLGDEAYSEAVGGGLSNKYYVSMKDSNGDYHLFVYDVSKGFWHREDDTQAIQFCEHRGDLFYIDHADDQIKSVRGTGLRYDEQVRWEAATGILGTDTPGKKYISKIEMRMSLAHGSRVLIFIEYDSCGEWELVSTLVGDNLSTFTIPIRPRRSDHLRLRISGYGEAKVFSMFKTIEEGSSR